MTHNVYIYPYMQVIAINKNRGQEFETEQGVVYRWILREEKEWMSYAIIL